MSSESSAPPAISIQGLGKRYEIYDRPPHRLWQFLWRGRRQFFREFWALREVNLEVQRGETVGIVGRNGAGKTTLLQCIAGTLTPTEGLVQVNGRVTALLELGSGFNLEFTGRENVFLNGAILGVSRREMEEKFDRIAAFADIGDFLDQPVKTYSSGMFVRLAFSVMANLDPDIFIVDEALAVGDAYFQHRCMLRFREMQEQGTTILYVSHDAMNMKQLCNRVLWIDRGKQMDFGDTERVVTGYLQSMFGIETAPPAPMRDASSPHPPEGTGENLMRIVEHETTIPGGDHRCGDQSGLLVGVGIYDRNSRPCSVFSDNAEIVLRVTYANHHLEPADHRWILGYRIRNHRGQEIAAYNTDFDETEITPARPGNRATYRFTIGLPVFHPGRYTFSIGLAYRRNGDTKIQVSDRIENAIVFQIDTRQQITCLMRLKTEISKEIIPEECTSTPVTTTSIREELLV